MVCWRSFYERIWGISEHGMPLYAQSRVKDFLLQIFSKPDLSGADL